MISRWHVGATPVFGEISLYTSRPLPSTIELPESLRSRILRPDLRMVLWENLRLGPTVADDVLFCPSYTRPFNVRARTVVAVHDVVYCAHPELFPRSQRYFYTPLYRWSARQAALVIADSEAVKQDLIRFFRLDAGRIRVTYLAPASCFRPIVGSVRRRPVRVDALQLDGPFFLFVGKMTGRRSPAILIEAFARLARTTTLPHQLVLVGPPREQATVTSLAAQAGIGERVHQTGFLSDDELNRLYNVADALVMPSIYETSSLPIMEAQAAGLPVICIGNPGLSEITGDAAFFVPVMNAERLSTAMIDLAQDEPLRQSLSKRGLESAARFSWARCARETMAVLEEAASA